MQLSKYTHTHEAGTRTGVGVNERLQNRSVDGSGNGPGSRTGTRGETCGRTQDGNDDGGGDVNEGSNGDEKGDKKENGDGNEDGIGAGGGEAKKRNKNGESLLSKTIRKRRQERVHSKAADLDNVENSKEAGGEAHGTQGLKKNCRSRESALALSRLIRSFRNYH